MFILPLCGFVLPLGHYNRWGNLPRQALAPWVFPMHWLQKAADGATLHLQGQLPLLPWMLQQPVCQEMCGLHQANHQWVTVFLFTPTPLTQLHSSNSRPYHLHLVYEPSHEQGDEALTCTLWTFDVFRFGWGQVHLLWGAAVAQRVFYLHAVLRVSSGTWFPHPAWQHRVQWLQQGEVSFHRLKLWYRYCGYMTVFLLACLNIKC